MRMHVITTEPRTSLKNRSKWPITLLNLQHSAPLCPSFRIKGIDIVVSPFQPLGSYGFNGFSRMPMQ